MIIAILLISSLIFLVSDISSQNHYVFSQSELKIDLKGSTSGNNTPVTNNFNLTSGYKITPVVWNLTAPDSVTFDDKDNMYIAEAGHPFTNLPTVPRILQVNPNGNLSTFLDKNLNSPIVDIAFHDGLLYVSHKNKISTVNTTDVSSLKDIIVGLPSNTDHQNNQIAFSNDGTALYVVDWGNVVFPSSETTPNSGIIWMIESTGKE